MEKKDLKIKYGNEKIAVVKKELLVQDLVEGFNPYNIDILKKVLKHHFFILRYNAEYNKRFKQPIAYIVFRHKDTYFLTKRLDKSGESRLVGGYAVGQGGHINPVDSMNVGNIVLNSVIREMHEELFIEPNSKLNSKIIGFINDNSNDVSQDHFGIVVLIDISKPTIQVKETDKHEGMFVTKEFLKENYDNLEAWSKLILDII